MSVKRLIFWVLHTSYLSVKNNHVFDEYFKLLIFFFFAQTVWYQYQSVLIGVLIFETTTYLKLNHMVWSLTETFQWFKNVNYVF